MEIYIWTVISYPYMANWRRHKLPTIRARVLDLKITVDTSFSIRKHITFLVADSICQCEQSHKEINTVLKTSGKFLKTTEVRRLH